VTEDRDRSSTNQSNASDDQTVLNESLAFFVCEEFTKHFSFPWGINFEKNRRVRTFRNVGDVATLFSGKPAATYKAS